MSTKIKKYPNGGEVDPNDPKQLATWNALKQKYASSLPQITQNGQKIGALDKRMDWVSWAKKALPTSGTPAELAAKAAKVTGFGNAGLLLASSMEEGLGMRFKGDDAYSVAYDEAKIDQKAFPVDGFRAYGLDQIGGRVDEFINKGYLPKDFKNKMKAFDAANEIDEKEYYDQVTNIALKNKLIDGNFKTQFTNKKTGKLDVGAYYDALDQKMTGFKGSLPTMKKSAKSAAFVDDESAMMAKAAFMRAEQDNVLNYAKQKGYKLTSEEQNFFTLASYNGGAGNGQKMLDYYGQKKLLGNNGFLKERMADKGQIYDNVMPRYAGGNMFNGENYFEKGGRIEYELGTEDPIKGQLKNTGNSFFAPSGEGFPSRDQQEGDLQVIPLNQGEPVKGPASPVVPLSQFYDKVNDQYGNTKFVGTGKYVTGDGKVNLLEDQQAEMYKVSAQNLVHANEMQNKLNNAERISSLGMTAINAYFNKQNGAKQDRMNLRNAILGEQSAQFINPYSEGTGSQAIMKNGGEIQGGALGVNTLDGGKSKVISTSDHSNPMIEFQGKDHDNGGIGIEYAGKLAEVENKEVGWIDNNGGLNIFGKLKVPGTNKTFRKLAKDTAKQEAEIDGNKAKYLKILNQGNAADPYQASAQSTAKVMFKSLDKQSKEIAEKKEALASYQNLILSMNNPENI